jgi:hypothetical protein
VQFPPPKQTWIEKRLESSCGGHPSASVRKVRCEPAWRQWYPIRNSVAVEEPTVGNALSGNCVVKLVTTSFQVLKTRLHGIMN